MYNHERNILSTIRKLHICYMYARGHAIVIVFVLMVLIVAIFMVLLIAVLIVASH